MAKKIQIEVTTAALKKIASLGIRYTVTQEYIELRALLFSCASNAELDEYEQDQIVECALKAMKKGDEYGISIGTQSGRDMNDERCYTLQSVEIVPADDACYTVEQMKNA